MRDGKLLKQPTNSWLDNLDSFKKFNDHHSHAFGDDVLRIVANILRESCRGIDRIGRYGSEEFVLVLPEADSEVA